MNQIEKAPFQKRVLAFLIDFFILCSIQSMIVFSVIIFTKPILFTRLIWANAIATSFNMLLYLIKDISKGTSIGKKFMKIAVRDSENYEKVPNTFKLILRNVFVLIWPIEFFILVLGKDGKRFGDRIANTDVVDVEGTIS